jgi:hypothetical protein
MRRYAVILKVAWASLARPQLVSGRLGFPASLLSDLLNKLVYASCGEGTVDVIRQLDADHYKKLKSVSTACAWRIDSRRRRVADSCIRGVFGVGVNDCCTEAIECSSVNGQLSHLIRFRDVRFACITDVTGRGSTVPDLVVSSVFRAALAEPGFPQFPLLLLAGSRCRVVLCLIEANVGRLSESLGR